YEGRATMDDFLAQITNEQLIDMMGGQPNTGVANTGGMGNLMEYGIPNIMTADGPQGVRIGVNCTAWPIGTLQACTWDVDLVEKVGKAAAVEAHNNGIDIWLAPGMNIHRDPLCGRFNAIEDRYRRQDMLHRSQQAASRSVAISETFCGEQ
ncbi:MAG: glycoside hydrolase family 3 N-terminal domain-containing protein, partial [Merdibacter sp.]